MKKGERLRGLTRARRFCPFQIVLADGTQIYVKHPEWIAYAGGRKAAIVDSDNGTYVIDLANVVRFKLLEG